MDTHPHDDVAQIMTVIWLGVLAICLLAWLVYRAWRRSHPRDRKPAQSYSEQLSKRLANRRTHSTREK